MHGLTLFITFVPQNTPEITETQGQQTRQITVIEAVASKSIANAERINMS